MNERQREEQQQPRGEHDISYEGTAYSWDRLYVEGVNAARCARMMAVPIRVAYAELANAKESARQKRQAELDQESAVLENPVYEGFHVYGVPWNIRRPVSEDGFDHTAKTLKDVGKD